MSHLVTVTGAGGNNGKAIASLLSEGVRVRALGRRPEALAPLAAMGADVWVGDLTDSALIFPECRGRTRRNGPRAERQVGQLCT